MNSMSFNFKWRFYKKSFRHKIYFVKFSMISYENQDLTKKRKFKNITSSKCSRMIKKTQEKQAYIKKIAI